MMIKRYINHKTPYIIMALVGMIVFGLSILSIGKQQVFSEEQIVFLKNNYHWIIGIAGLIIIVILTALKLKENDRNC